MSEEEDYYNNEESFDDYINASWVDSLLHRQCLIAASAPKQSTVTDWLQMIMEKNVTLIMKVCEDKVSGREQSFRYTGKQNTSSPSKQSSSASRPTTSPFSPVTFTSTTASSSI